MILFYVGATALWYATRNDNLETIELLCKNNSSCDVNTKYGESDLAPLHLACKQNYVYCTDFLLILKILCNNRKVQV